MLKSFIFVFMSLVLSEVSFAQQGAAKAFVSLNPAGDFVANLKAKGSAQQTGTKVSAKNIVVDMKSLATGLDLRDDHAKNKYLEVNKYPEAILTEATGENGKGQGKLKWRDKENPVSGTYKVQGKNLIAEFKIKLSEYGITSISYKGIGVEDDVKLEVQVPITVAATAVAAPAAAAKGAKPVAPTANSTQPIKK